MASNARPQEAGSPSVATLTPCHSKLQKLCTRLAENDPLTRAVRLRNQDLDHDFAVTLGATLPSTRFLRRLDLTGNLIGDDGTMALTAGLGDNCSLRHLILDRCGVSDAGAAALATVLRAQAPEAATVVATANMKSALSGASPCVLERLHLSGNCIGDSGAEVLGQSLHNNTRCVMLDLRKNVIGDKGAKALLGGIENGRVLLIRFARNPICTSLRRLLERSLRTNVLLEAVARGAGTFSFAADLCVIEGDTAVPTGDNGDTPTVEEAGLGACFDEDDEGNRDGVNGMTRAECREVDQQIEAKHWANGNDGRFRLRGFGLRRLALAIIENARSTLMPTPQPGTAVMMGVVGGSITALSLARCRIGDKGVGILAQMLKRVPNMIFLDLRENDIGCDGTAAVSMMASVLGQSHEAKRTKQEKSRAQAPARVLLHTLRLGRNRIGRNGSELLALALQNNIGLTSLDLSSNAIGSWGVVALARALKGNRTLTSLDISSNEVEARGAFALASMLCGESNGPSADASDGSGDESCIEYEDPNRPFAAPCLRNLHIGNNMLGGAGVKQILTALLRPTLYGHGCCLSRLEMGGALWDYMKDSRAERKAQHMFLELYNVLARNAFIESLLAVRPGSKNAAVLTLVECCCSSGCTPNRQSSKATYDASAGVGVIVSDDVEVQSVDTTSSQAESAVFAPNSALLRVVLNAIMPKIASHAAKSLATPTEAQLRAGVAPLTFVKTLDCSRCPRATTDVGVVCIARALARNETITAIDLSFGACGVVGATALASALVQGHASLRSLTVSGNPLTDEGVAQLASALSEASAHVLPESGLLQCGLHALRLSSVRCGSKGATGLARALQCQHQVLQLLDISCNHLRSADVAAISTALAQNNSLHSLYIGGNFVCDTGATELSSALQRNSKLTKLDMRDADIGPDGMIAFAPLLRVGSVPLHTLNLAENRAGDAGAAALAAPLHANTTLRQLCLGHNLIGQAGMARLNNALSIQHDEYNETLVQLPDVETQEANHWKQSFV